MQHTYRHTNTVNPPYDQQEQKTQPRPQKKQSKHAPELPQGTAATWRLSWALQILLGGVEQASISSFCLEDFHPHSNKTEVPQASPSH